jgi:hypothetical protein
MGKLTKHAEVLTQLHSLVKKQAEEAQKNISGVPGETVKSESIREENETTDKNSVGPENNAQGMTQKPSEDASTPVSSAKSAADLGAEILDLIRKEAEAQDKVTGVPGKDTNPEKTDEKHESTDKNDVGADKNKPQTTGEQKDSNDSSEPAKKAQETLDELANKTASYNLGREFCAALLKAASAQSEQDETQIVKEAGRRDFELLIAQAAADLENEKTAATTQYAEAEAEAAGAAYFEEVLKQAALQEALLENDELKAKVASLSSVVDETVTKEAQEKATLREQELRAKLAEDVANIVLQKINAAAQSNA